MLMVSVQGRPIFPVAVLEPLSRDAKDRRDIYMCRCKEA